MNQGGWDTRGTRRVRVTKTKVTKRDRTDEVLPLDPHVESWRSQTFRDEQVARAKGR